MGSREPDDLTLIHQVGSAVCRRGWRTPALLALEAGRPLALLGGQLLWVLEPTLSFVGFGRFASQLARLLEMPEAVDALVSYLEVDNPEPLGE